MGRLLELDLPVQYIQGNGDREVLARMRGQEMSPLPRVALEAIEWTAAQLGSEHEHALASWPATLRRQIAGVGDVLFCHATPRSDTANFTRLTPEARLVPIFEESGADVVVCGHTHMQFDRRVGKVRVLNAGSVGMPFGEPGAYWLLFGPSGVELRHTSYNLAAAAELVRNSSYPQANDFAERKILHPPTEKAMLGVFENAS
jgi:predicted phosphodiesterase